MMTIRKNTARGHADHGWLNSWHSFSFADYRDPAHMGYGALRVINDDTVAPGGGFGTHGHRDMEIISYVLDGALEHKDSMGNGSVLRPGDVQRMSAGRGVRHSEFNGSREAPVHFLQIWIEPSVTGIAPGYEEKHYTPADRRGQWRLVAAPEGSQGNDGALTLHQDARIYAGLLDGAESATHTLVPGRRAWVQVARGSLSVNGQRLEAGDGAAISGEPTLTLTEGKDAEVLLFELA